MLYETKVLVRSSGTSSSARRTSPRSARIGCSPPSSARDCAGAKAQFEQPSPDDVLELFGDDDGVDLDLTERLDLAEPDRVASWTVTGVEPPWFFELDDDDLEAEDLDDDAREDE